MSAKDLGSDLSIHIVHDVDSISRAKPMRIPKDVVETIMRYTESIHEIVRRFRNTIALLNEGRANEAKDEITKAIKSDTQADELRREIAEKHLRNIDDPDLRENLLKLLRMLDKVSEWTKEAARYLDIVPYPVIPNDIRRCVDELSRLALEGIENVVLAIKALIDKDVNRAISYCKRVEEIEEEADKVTHNARQLLVIHGKRFENPTLVIMTRDFIEALENITDYEEDVSDIIRILMTASIT